MVKLRFKIHPLFIIFGIYFALTGKVFSFLIYTLTALIHETGHFIQSEKYGYALKKIVLMPYGAVIEGNVSDMRFKDELFIALAGPLTNLVVAVCFIALWWIFPVTYPYTDLVVFSNVAIAVINLIPCYPLDGGRVLLALLSLRLKRNKALLIVKILGVLFSILGFSLFIYSVFNQINLTLLFFSLFMLFGALSKSKDGEYLRIFENFNYKELKNPRETKNIVVGGNTEVRQLYPFINGEYYYVVTVITGGEKTILEGRELYAILSSKSGYEKLGAIIKGSTPT